MKIKLLTSYLAIAALVAACGGESEKRSVDIVVEIPQPSSSSSSSSTSTSSSGSPIVNTSLPIVENFDSADSVDNFFSETYKALATDQGAGSNNFYFSIAGVYTEDEATYGQLDPDRKQWVTADADPGMRLGSARFSIAQTSSEFATPEQIWFDPRQKSSPGTTSDSWGELDLSEEYTVSFCLVAAGGLATKLVQIYVDNNQSSSSASIHGNSSRIFNLAINELQPLVGTRVSVTSSVGTANSYLQIRAENDGYVVIDDLVVETASNPAPAQPDCSIKTTEYAESEDGGIVEQPTGIPFGGLPLNETFSTDRDSFFGTGTADFLAISNDAANPFYKALSGSSRVLINGAGNLFFGNALWDAGDITGTATTSTAIPNGDMDLSGAYRITIEIEAVPTFAGSNGFQVAVDNNTSSSSNSIHGSASRLVNLVTPDLTTGTLIINVPGNVTMNGAVIDTVDEHRGTDSSFLAFRCPSDCGDPTGTPASGVEISSILVEATGAAVVPGTPRIPTLSADDAQIAVSWLPVGGATAYDVAYGIVDDPTDAGTQIVEDIAGTSTTITGLTNGTTYFVFVRSQNATGNSGFSDNGDDPNPSATPVGLPPATPAAPALTAGEEQINVTWTAVTNATAYDVAYNTTDSTSGATEILDIAGTGTTISGLTGDTQYFVFVRAKNVAGTSAYGPSSSATPTVAAAGSWTGSNLDLVGASGGTPSGTIDVNSATAVTITATGGDLGSSVFRAFYAYQAGVNVPFTFTARLASVTETDNGTFESTGNSRRYGIYIMESLAPAAAYAELGRFAGLELYASDATPTFTGSRSEKRDILFVATDPMPQTTTGTTRGRGDTTIAVGDYLRIQVSQPDPLIDEYLIQRFVSSDGVAYTENTSNNQWLNANGHALPAQVYVGFIAAPNADTLTIEFDNISIVEN